jgi:hypothetical protein
VAAVGTELDMAVAQLDDLRDSTLGARSFENGFDGLVNGAAVTVAADNSHDFIAHICPLAHHQIAVAGSLLLLLTDSL